MAGIRDDAPTVVDDTGTGRDGTPVDETWYDALLDALDEWIYSPTNPTVKPRQITDEVVEARGSQPSLDDRLDEEHNEDGTHNLTGTLGTLITQSQFLGGLGGVNLVTNDDFQLWPSGDTSAPDGFTLAGAGASIARAGTGLGDTNRKIGDFCAKITRAGADVTLTKTILDASSFTRASYLQQLYACGGGWVLCSTPNVARIGIYDGVGTTYSSYHTGGGTWEFLPVTRQINVAATQLAIIPAVGNSNTSGYFSGLTLLVLNSDQDLVRYVESPVVQGTFHFVVAGTVGTGTGLGRFTPARSGIVKTVQLHAVTAPTGQALIVDVNTWDGASYTSMFSSNPQIAAAANDGGSSPEGTYARRCFVGWSGTSIPTGGRVSVDVDQVGSGTAGADLTIEVRSLQYQSPLDRYQST